MKTTKPVDVKISDNVGCYFQLFTLRIRGWRHCVCETNRSRLGLTNKTCGGSVGVTVYNYHRKWIAPDTSAILSHVGSHRLLM